MKLEILESKITQAIAYKDEEKLKKLCVVLKQGIISSIDERYQYFLLLIKILSDKNLLDLSSAWDYFFLLKNHRELLTDSQKSKFIPQFISICHSFNEESIDSTKILLNQALFDKNEVEFKKCVDAIDTSFFGLNHFPVEIFEFCLSVLRETEFLDFDKSWYLLFIFDLNFSTLSCEQENALLCEFETLFSFAKYQMLNFMIIEILGKRYSDERALGVLTRLMAIEAEDSRSLVPHGLEHIAFQNESLASQAYCQLVKMQDDPSVRVKEEVSISLLKIQTDCINTTH
jgi:hypothetical protein